MKIKNIDRTRLLKEAVNNGLKILYYDIETSLMEVYTHYIGDKVSIHHHQIKVPSKVITIQYMFEGDRQAKYLEWTKLIDGHDDSAMLQDFVTNIYSQAHIVVTQNGDAFDHKTLAKRVLLHGLQPLETLPSIDILKLSRNSFRAPSHKLDYRSSQYGLGGKHKMEFQDWIDLSENKAEVSKKMGPYGCKDVMDTRQVFWKELEYYKTLPCLVEKKISEFLPNLKSFCSKCAKQRQRRFDLDIINISEKRKKITCRNCNTTWNETIKKIHE